MTYDLPFNESLLRVIYVAREILVRNSSLNIIKIKLNQSLISEYYLIMFICAKMLTNKIWTI